MSRPLPILTYHRVGRPGPRARLRGMFTTPAALHRHLGLLRRRGFTPCDFEDLWRARVGEAELPRRPVLLTFDDGHLDNLTLGLEVLRAHGAKATVFVVGKDVGRRGVVWADGAEQEPVDLFDWDQARRLERAGVRIEAHGWEHRPMDRMDRAELVQALTRCRTELRRQLGREALALAYPYGAWNTGCTEAARAAGFAFACTTEERPADLDRDDPMALPRLAVRGYRWIHQLEFRRALGRIRR